MPRNVAVLLVALVVVWLLFSQPKKAASSDPVALNFAEPKMPLQRGYA